MARKNKIQEEICKSINALNEKDTYVMMLFALYTLKNDPTYTTLAELCYLLSDDSLSKFLAYYQGMTIKVPTLKEMRTVTKGLTMYQLVNVEGKNPSLVIGQMVEEDISAESIKKAYQAVVEALQKYDFQRIEKKDEEEDV